MFEFKNLTVKDRAVVQPLLQQFSQQFCNFSFANQILWGEPFHAQFAITDEMLLLRFQLNEEHYFHFPMGKGDPKPILEKMMEYAKQQNVTFGLSPISEEMKLFLEVNFPNRFTFSSSRNYYDYLYQTKDLIELKGKHYQPKRNHINKFKKLYNYAYAPITQRDISDCLETHEQWIAEQDCGGEKCPFEQETCAVKTALNNFEAIGMTGGLLRVDGKVAAFTLGQAINAATFDVCIEKALSEYEGAYAMINQQFLVHHAADFPFVNREEDMGVEGLRKAKLSYQPYRLLVKYRAVLNE
ncbi:MAG: phosphatidylglycerol lysyltransferase domain-containing protein [Lentimicrobiaceae bacterium]|nr:phosphatidylglycerol lysyltransferase domain-containing protein [Lentimicrobiaceae bacterium]